MDSRQIAVFLQSTALTHGWKLQPNGDILKNRIAAMRKRQAAGHIVCPCKAFVDQYTTPDSFCPCSEAGDAIKKDGCCHCNVFLAGDDV